MRLLVAILVLLCWMPSMASAAHWVAPGLYEEGYADGRDGTEGTARITAGADHRWVADDEALWQAVSRHAR